jgi:hypothetical protein
MGSISQISCLAADLPLKVVTSCACEAIPVEKGRLVSPKRKIGLADQDEIDHQKLKCGSALVNVKLPCGVSTC